MPHRIRTPDLFFWPMDSERKLLPVGSMEAAFACVWGGGRDHASHLVLQAARSASFDAEVIKKDFLDHQETPWGFDGVMCEYVHMRVSLWFWA